MDRAPYNGGPPWQHHPTPNYGSNAYASNNVYYSGENSLNEHRPGEAYYSSNYGRNGNQQARHEMYPPPTYEPSQPPTDHSMRIRGAAGTEYDMCIRGAARHDQPQNHFNSSRPEDQLQQNDLAQPLFPQDAWSRSSTRARSSSTSDQQALNTTLAEQKHSLQKKDEHIQEQYQTITRLASEKRALSASVKGLTEVKNRLTQQLEEKEKELRHVAYHDPELSRRREEFIAGQSRKLRNFNGYVKDLQAQIQNFGQVPVPPPAEETMPSSSTQDLQAIEAPEDHVDLEDDLEALDFLGDFGLPAADWVSPMERRIQALEATMEENDCMESHQPVIVSKYFRNSKEAIWAKPIDRTGHWHTIKDDPAFADIATNGHIVAFEELYQRKEAMFSSYNVEQDYQYLSHWPTMDKQDGYQEFSPQQRQERRLSNEQEDRLAALGVSGDPKPVKPYEPEKAKGRSRSRSPEFMVKRGQQQNYRQRGYESYRPDWRSTERKRERVQGDGDTENLEAAMGANTARHIKSRFGNGQPNPNKRKGGKGKAKNTQQQQQNRSEVSNQTQHQRLSQSQTPNASTDHSGNGRPKLSTQQRRTASKQRKIAAAAAAAAAANNSATLQY